VSSTIPDLVDQVLDAGCGAFVLGVLEEKAKTDPDLARLVGDACRWALADVSRRRRLARNAESLPPDAAP
jgi:hypothetical protein